MNALVIVLGFLLDMLFGDPLGAIHPVRGIGFIITCYEKAVYRKMDRWTFAKGVGLVAVVLATGVGAGWLVITLCDRLGFYAGLGIRVLVAWSVLSAKGLKTESMKVYDALKGDEPDRISRARSALSMIVGRDTRRLGEEEIVRATVETVAENLSDGELAPLFYMTLAGPLGGICYKCINTMDSMVGYKNDKYLHYGRPAAKLDDAANFIPARLSGLMACVAAGLLGFDGKGAFSIFKRDRNLTDSPNAGQTESAFAGALGICLGGEASYFGKTVNKPVLGEAKRPPEKEDILRANRLMYGSAYLAVLPALGLILVNAFNSPQVVDFVRSLVVVVGSHIR